MYQKLSNYLNLHKIFWFSFHRSSLLLSDYLHSFTFVSQVHTVCVEFIKTQVQVRRMDKFCISQVVIQNPALLMNM